MSAHDPLNAECTGIAASWCPNCGECACPRSEEGEIEWHYKPGVVSVHGFPAWSETAEKIIHHDRDCPLHGFRGRHEWREWSSLPPNPAASDVC